MHTRPWVQERQARTRHLIELGGLVVKAGLEEATGDDRTLILGTLLTVAERLRHDPKGEIRDRWRRRGADAFAASMR